MAAEIKLLGGGGNARVNLIAACRRLAIQDGTTLEEALWEATRGMIAKAAEGNVEAYQLLMKWFGKYELEGAEPKESKGAALNVGIGLGLPADGPAAIGESPEYAAEVKRVIGELAPPADDLGDILK